MVDAEEIHAQVRPFAKTIVAKVSSPASERRLKRIATSKIDQLEAQIYDSTRVANYEVTKYVYKKYRVSDPETFNKRITERLDTIKAALIQYTSALLACVLVALILWWLMRKQVNLQTPLFVFSLAFALLLLVTGSLLPVIEVDARIKSLEIVVMGSKVQFLNQVLFYQSKSVLGIVTTLIGQPKPDAVVVGVLIMLFVLILPLLRLIAKGIYVLSTKKIARHPVVRYLTFELEKWDMADVMVVGMVMTFIGLNGIIKSQLSMLNINSGGLKLITANGTSMQPGYFLFVAYVVFSILLSYILKKTSPSDDLK
ncbi:paraquat-inducible protein A [Mucilaginibacter antarcticus]